MIWTAFITKVLGYSDVDATRRGITAFRDSFIKAAVVDLKHFVDLFKDDVDGAEYSGTDKMPFYPFDESAAEATAMFFKSRVARTIDKDLAMYDAYQKDYARIRRRLMREVQDLVLEPEATQEAACLLHQAVHCSLPQLLT